MTRDEDIYSITNILDGFGKALNSADIRQILFFFDTEAMFMPNEHKSFNSIELRNLKGNFFHRNLFTIVFSISSINTDGAYAFVTAIAHSTTTQKDTLQKKENVTRDFFVFRKTEDEWRIFRYMFNDLQELI